MQLIMAYLNKKILILILLALTLSPASFAFAQSTASAPMNAIIHNPTIADINRDGKLEIVSGGENFVSVITLHDKTRTDCQAILLGGNSNIFYLNKGNIFSQTLVFGDINRDGKAEIVANVNGSKSLILNDRTYTNFDLANNIGDVSGGILKKENDLILKLNDLYRFHENNCASEGKEAGDTIEKSIYNSGSLSFDSYTLTDNDIIKNNCNIGYACTANGTDYGICDYSDKTAADVCPGISGQTGNIDIIRRSIKNAVAGLAVNYLVLDSYINPNKANSAPKCNGEIVSCYQLLDASSPQEEKIGYGAYTFTHTDQEKCGIVPGPLAPNPFGSNYTNVTTPICNWGEFFCVNKDDTGKIASCSQIGEISGSNTVGVNNRGKILDITTEKRDGTDYDENAPFADPNSDASQIFDSRTNNNDDALSLYISAFEKTINKQTPTAEEKNVFDIVNAAIVNTFYNKPTRSNPFQVAINLLERVGGPESNSMYSDVYLTSKLNIVDSFIKATDGQTISGEGGCRCDSATSTTQTSAATCSFDHSSQQTCGGAVCTIYSSIVHKPPNDSNFLSFDGWNYSRTCSPDMTGITLPNDKQKDYCAGFEQSLTTTSYFCCDTSFNCTNATSCSDCNPLVGEFCSSSSSTSYRYCNFQTCKCQNTEKKTYYENPSEPTEGYGKSIFACNYDKWRGENDIPIGDGTVIKKGVRGLWLEALKLTQDYGNKVSLVRKQLLPLLDGENSLYTFVNMKCSDCEVSQGEVSKTIDTSCKLAAQNYCSEIMPTNTCLAGDASSCVSTKLDYKTVSESLTDFCKLPFNAYTSSADQKIWLNNCTFLMTSNSNYFSIKKQVQTMTNPSFSQTPATSLISANGIRALRSQLIVTDNIDNFPQSSLMLYCKE